MGEDERWLICPECGNEQPDMGKGVRCEECGAAMPDDLDDEPAGEPKESEQ